MDLHSAGHRHGVVAAPHAAAAEAGRAMLAEGGNAIEAMVAMAAAIAAVYPHMNHIGGDGFWLIRERNGRVRALMAAGRAGAQAERELYRDHEAIPARGPLAALTVPGAISGWALALEAARAAGGRLPLASLLGHAIRHTREGYVVTRSQARLTAEKLPELKDVPGFAQTFLVDGRPPEAGRTMRQEALAGTLDHLAHAGLDDFYRGDVGREIAAELDRIGSPVTRADLVQHRAGWHALQHAAADPGACLAHYPDAVRAPADRRGGRLRPRAWPGRGDQARFLGARPRHHRSRPATGTGGALPRSCLPRRRGGKDRPPQGGALAGDSGRRRHDLDGRRRPRWDRGLLHPVALLGVRLGLRAAGDRRTDAEPRRELCARSRRAQCARAGPPAVPHPQPGTRRADRRPGHRLRHHGRRRPAAEPGRAVHPPRAVSPAARPRHRRAALAARPHLGLAVHQPARRVAVRRPPDRSPAL